MWNRDVLDTVLSGRQFTKALFSFEKISICLTNKLTDRVPKPADHSEILIVLLFRRKYGGPQPVLRPQPFAESPLPGTPQTVIASHICLYGFHRFIN